MEVSAPLEALQQKIVEEIEAIHPLEELAKKYTNTEEVNDRIAFITDLNSTDPEVMIKNRLDEERSLLNKLWLRYDAEAEIKRKEARAGWLDDNGIDSKRVELTDLNRMRCQGGPTYFTFDIDDKQMQISIRHIDDKNVLCGVTGVFSIPFDEIRKKIIDVFEVKCDEAYTKLR